MTTSCNALPTCWAPFKVRKVRDLDQSAAATRSVGGMAVQLSQAALHVAEGEPTAVLLGGGEVGGKQLADLDHAHGADRRPGCGRGAPIGDVCPTDGH